MFRPLRHLDVLRTEGTQGCVEAGEAEMRRSGRGRGSRSDRIRGGGYPEGGGSEDKMGNTPRRSFERATLRTLTIAALQSRSRWSGWAREAVGTGRDGTVTLLQGTTAR